MRQHVLAGTLVLCVGLLLSVRTQAEDKAPASEDSCRRATFKVLIDVGHTPEDPGAISAHGNPEYGYNLALANAAMTQLVDAGFRQTTLLLAKGKGYEQLVHRAGIANRIAPDLLISIHHDSTRERY